MTKCPEGSPWDWGDLTDKELIKLSELSALDGRGPESPLFQYFAVRTVLALQSGITAGSGFDVLRAVAECARCGLVMPDWLARAFLNRYRAVTQFEAKSWDDPLSFGPPYPKGTNIRAKRKARSKGRELYVRVNALRAQHPDKSLVSAFDEVGTDMGIGKTLAEEYYYANKARFASTIVNKQAPAKSTKTPGRQRPPR